MKKLFMLAGIAAAAFGVIKLLRGKHEDEFAPPSYTEYQPQA